MKSENDCCSLFSGLYIILSSEKSYWQRLYSSSDRVYAAKPMSSVLFAMSED